MNEKCLAGKPVEVAGATIKSLIALKMELESQVASNTELTKLIAEKIFAIKKIDEDVEGLKRLAIENKDYTDELYIAIYDLRDNNNILVRLLDHLNGMI